MFGIAATCSNRFPGMLQACANQNSRWDTPKGSDVLGHKTGLGGALSMPVLNKKGGYSPAFFSVSLDWIG